MNDTTTSTVAALALAVALATGVEVIRLAYRRRDTHPTTNPPPAREPATLRGSIRDLVHAFIRGAGVFGVVFGILLALALYRGEITPVQALDKVEHYAVTAGGIFVDVIAAVRSGDASEDQDPPSDASTTTPQDSAPPGLPEVTSTTP